MQIDTETFRGRPPTADQDSIYPECQNEYKGALLELDPKKLRKRVAAAETAIFNRLQTLSQSADNRTERQAIKDALANLRVLMREKLGFPLIGKRSSHAAG